MKKIKNRADYLKELLSTKFPDLPANCKYRVFNGVFDDSLTEVLNGFDEQKKILAPAFVMIDPFGVSDTPMSLIERIMQSPSCEVYISFMWEHINRFKEHPDFESSLDSLYGCKHWRDGLSITDELDQKKFFYNRYASQLRRAGAQYVLHFELYDNKRLKYAIFFGTQNLQGCNKMKIAIWKVAPRGDFRFRGVRNNQLEIGIDDIDIEPLKKILKTKYKDKGWIPIKEIIEFMMSDETDYCLNHLKTKTLCPMEDDGEIEIAKQSRGKKRSYPNGSMIKFL